MPRRLSLAALAVLAAAPVLAAQTPSPLEAEIKRRAQAVTPQVVAWRRDIHEHPELGNRETRTAALIAAHLRSLGLEVRTGVATTGVVGILRGAKPGPSVALRADMDALPVTEESSLPFKSVVRTEYNGQQVGVMHACGHDNHVAILLATEPTVIVGERVTLRATMRDAQGHRLGGRTVTWKSSAPRIAKVSEEGVVLVLDRGAVQITATCDQVSGSATLYVSRVGVHRLAVHPRVSDLSIADELQLNVDLLDRTGARLGGRVIEWTSTDPAVAEVDASGRVFARAAGWTTVIAWNAGISASMPLQVHPATIAVFRMIPVSATLAIGETLQCQVLAANAQGRVIPDVEVSWASGDTSIAAVSPEGLVLALRPGIVKVAAGITGRRATVSLTVSRGDEDAC